MKIPATKKEAVERMAEMYKEIRELEEIVSGARINEESLLNYLTNICALIYFDWPKETRDSFVADMIDIGLYDPMDTDDTDEDIIGLA
jgi:hypothetical protein